MESKAIQIISTIDSEDLEIITALHDDGTIWTATINYDDGTPCLKRPWFKLSDEREIDSSI